MGNDPQWTGSKKVLIAEDEMIIGLAFAMELRSLGHIVIGPFARVSQALPLTTLPDIAILDYNLADDTSDRLILELEKAHVPCVIVSGSRFAGRDGLTVLSKPVKPTIVVETALVHRFIEGIQAAA